MTHPVIKINHHYDLLNLNYIYNNYSQIKSNIYTKNRILIMINKKKILISHLNNIIDKIYTYELYIYNHNNNQNLTIHTRIKDLKNKLDNIIYLLNKIEWEENLILSTLPKTKNNKLCSFFKCFK